MRAPKTGSPEVSPFFFSLKKNIYISSVTLRPIPKCFIYLIFFFKIDAQMVF